MYKTLLFSGAILLGGLIACASGGVDNPDNGATKQKPANPPDTASPDKPRTDTPPVPTPKEQNDKNRLEAISKTVAALAALKIPELYNKYVDLNTLEILDYDTLLNRLKTIQVIYVAEQHTNEAHHNLQLNILKSLSQKNPKTALAMEFLYRSKQESIDNYSADKITEEEFDKAVLFGFGEWYHYYTPLIRYAHKTKIKVIGMNVEKEIKSKLAEMGWDKLTPDEQKLIAKDIDTSNKAHKEFVMKQFQGMMNDPRTKKMMQGPMMERMYLMQCIWDETFAEAIANYLKAVNDPAVQVVVVAGAGHIEYKFNIPERAYKRNPAPYKTLIPVEVNNPVELNLTESLLDSNRGDFIYFSPHQGEGESPIK